MTLKERLAGLSMQQSKNLCAALNIQNTSNNPAGRMDHAPSGCHLPRDHQRQSSVDYSRENYEIVSSIIDHGEKYTSVLQTKIQSENSKEAIYLCLAVLVWQYTQNKRVVFEVLEFESGIKNLREAQLNIDGEINFELLLKDFSLVPANANDRTRCDERRVDGLVGLVWNESAIGGDDPALPAELVFTARPGKATLELSLKFPTAFYEARTAQRILDQLSYLTGLFLQNRSVMLRGLELLNQGDQGSLFRGWQGPKTPHIDTTVLHIFQDFALHQPEKVAVVTQDECLSYRDLDDRSDEIAKTIQSVLGNSQKPIAIFHRRTANMIVAVLASLKSGAPYVPIEPAHSNERIKTVLEDAGVDLILTESHLAPRAEAIVSAHMICLDQPGSQACRAGMSASLPDPDPGSLAYLLYTSGSTGRPKGVMVEHSSLVNFAVAIGHQYGFLKHDKVLMFASLSFDVSVYEIFVPLCFGATICLAGDDARSDPKELQGFIKSSDVTIAELPPSLMPSLDPSDLPSLRLVSVGGEPFGCELVNRWAPHCKFFNGYGPTEATVAVTQMECRAPMHDTPPIGRPMANHRCYVLNEHGDPVPIGAVGELYIGGPGVARGYLHRPEETEHCFGPDPVFPNRPERFYRSGDLVRWRFDGNLVFVGRRDRQVKVRGHRIELDEVEAALLQHPGIEQAAVIASPDRLDAYIVGPEVGGLDRAVVHRYLLAFLAPYATPSGLYAVAEIPLTTNHKVDVAELCRAPAVALGSDHELRSPTTTLQQQILDDIFLPILDVSCAGVDESFFELGGTSLTATRIVSWVRSIFGVDIGLAAFYRDPTVENLARIVTENIGLIPGGSETGSDANAMPATVMDAPRRTDSIPLAPSQLRLFRLESGRTTRPISTLLTAYDITGPLDVPVLRNAFQEVIRRHDALRTIIRLCDGCPHQIILPLEKFDLPFEQADSVDGNAQQIELLITEFIEKQRQDLFDISRGPLVRLALLPCGRSRHVLVMTVHHIVSDGWSIGLLLNEFEYFYDRLKTRTAVENIPAKRTFAEYARRHADWLESPESDRQFDYWINRLAMTGDDMAAIRSVTEQANRRSEFAPRRLPLELGRGAVNGLAGLQKDTGATMFSILLSLYAIAYGHAEAKADVVIGAPVAGRDGGFEEVVGFFANTLPFCTPVHPDWTVRAMIDQSMITVAEALDNQLLPEDVIAEENRTLRVVDRLPLFQTVFAVQNTGHSEFSLRGTETSSIIDSEVAPIIEFYSDIAQKLDMTVVLARRDDRFIGLFEYNGSLYSEEWANCFVADFTRLVSLAEGYLDRTVADLIDAAFDVETGRPRNKLAIAG